MGFRQRMLCTAGVLALAGAAGCGTLPRDFDLGFLASRDMTPGGARRFRMLGPLVETQRDAQNRAYVAVRPFCALLRDPTTQRARTDVLWPVGVSKDFREERDWRFVVAMGHDFDTRKKSRYRMSIFPLLFAGRDQGGHGYFALFPLGGTLHEFLGRDRIQFFLFPLYAHGVVEGHTESHDILWPLISRTKGPSVSRFRFFPFYGRSVSRNRWTKQFVLWPLWTSVRYAYPDEPGGGYMVFPLWGHAWTKDRESWTVLPPLFRYTRGPTRTDLYCPWPIVRRTTGDVNRFNVWPLWGWKAVDDVRAWFVLVNFIRHEDVTRRDELVHRFMVFPLVYRETRRVPPKKDVAGAAPGEVRASTLEIWPLFCSQRDKDTVRWSAPDLWPGKNLAAVERSYAPLWTLYSHERVGAMVEDEALWGVFRRQLGPSGGRWSLFPLWSQSWSREGAGMRAWSALLGLAGCRREGLRTEYRVLYFLRFGKTAPQPEREAAKEPPRAQTP